MDIIYFLLLSIESHRITAWPPQEDPNADDDGSDLPPERIRKLLGIRMHGRISRVNLGRTGYYGSLGHESTWKGEILPWDLAIELRLKKGGILDMNGMYMI